MILFILRLCFGRDFSKPEDERQDGRGRLLQEGEEALQGVEGEKWDYKRVCVTFSFLIFGQADVFCEECESICRFARTPIGGLVGKMRQDLRFVIDS